MELLLPDTKHVIVTSRMAFGPFSVSEVLEFIKNDPTGVSAILWISPDDGGPLLVGEWLADYDHKGTVRKFFESEVADSLENVSDSEDDGADGDDAQTEQPDTTDGPHRRAEPPPDVGGKALVAFRKSDGSHFREFMALICLAVLGIVLLWMGVKSFRPAKVLQEQDKKAAKSLESTPDSLRTFQTLLEGKITRDPKKYSRSLLAMQKDISVYPDGYLPSKELTAAIALVHLSHDELDRIDGWSQLLLRLPAESRQRGLAVVAYELSRLLAARRILLEKTNKSSKKTVQMLQVQRAVDEVDIILERILRVVPGTQPDERVLHGVLLSRLMALSLITVMEHPEVAKKNIRLKQSLGKIPDIYPFLSTPDKGIVAELLKNAEATLAPSAEKVSWSKSLERLGELSSETRFLCQLNETGSGADAVLFYLAQSSLAKQSIPQVIRTFDTCFVGLRLYPRSGGSAASTQESSVSVFTGAGPVDEILLKNYQSRFPTYQAAVQTLRGSRSPAGEWMLVLHQNGVLTGKILGLKNRSREALCGKQSAKTYLCSQVLWRELSDRWRDLVPLALELRDEVNPEELQVLAQNFLFNTASEVLKSRRDKKTTEILEAIRSGKGFVDTEDPQLQFLFDYIQSVGVDT